MEYKIPSDNDLVEEFLYNKIHNKPLPTHLNILEYDLYGNKNPWEIWEEFEDTSYSYGGKDLYIFTTLKEKSANNKRYLRIIGLGSWESKDSGKSISTKDGNHVIGMKKRFCFQKSGTPQDGGWYLYEYSLNTSSVTGKNKFSNYVLCRFRRNERKKRIELPNTPKPPNNVLFEEEEDFGLAAIFPNNVLFEEEEDFGLAAIFDNKNACLGKDIHQGSREKPRADKIDVEEEEEEDDGDDYKSWPELFAKKLAVKDSSIQEEVQMLPNPFADEYLKDFMIEKH